MGAGSHRAPSPGDGMPPGGEGGEGGEGEGPAGAVRAARGVSFNVSSAAEVELAAKPEPAAKKPRASWQPARRATGWGVRDPRRAADRAPLWKVRAASPLPFRAERPGPGAGRPD